jgi:hypothetical protein
MHTPFFITLAQVKLFIDGKCRKRIKVKERRMIVGGNGFRV